MAGLPAYHGRMAAAAVEKKRKPVGKRPKATLRDRISGMRSTGAFPKKAMPKAPGPRTYGAGVD